MLHSAMTRTQRQARRPAARGRLLCCSALGVVLATFELCSAQAAPAGASVPAGVASAPAVSTSGSVTNVKLNQSRTIIDWSSFQIASGETVNFNFNAGSDIVLNRTLGQVVVDGALNGLVGGQAGGNVWLYGGQGVLFGPNARVNVGSLLATTTPLSSTTDFLSGSNSFTFQGGAADASILARAGARLSSHGALALIAPSVATEAGAQVSADGTVLYGAAQNFRIHFDESAGGNLDLVDFEVPSSALQDGSVSTTPLAIAGDTAGGKAVFAAVSRPSVMNAVISLGGLVTAKSAVQGEGGEIILSASGAPASVQVGGALQADRSVSMTAAGGKIEVSGAVTARDAAGQGGAVTLGDASTAFTTVDAGGRLDVASTRSGQTGGRAVVTGGTVDVEGTMDASAAAGGGAIRVGGGFHGEDQTVANADQVTVGQGALLNADATVAGDGGSVVLWSQGVTSFAGRIQARGGPGGGNGGQAEVSSLHLLDYRGLADLTASKGALGGLLLDPDDITIQTGGAAYTHGTSPFTAAASSVIDPAEIATQIATAALTINTTTTITFANPIVYNNASGSSQLNLNAGGGFVFNVSPFSVTGAGGLKVNLTAAEGGSHANFSLLAGTTLDTGGGTLGITGDAVTLLGTVNAGQLNLSSSAAGGISGTGAITASGFNASASGTGNINLNGLTNSITGTIILTGVDVALDNNRATSIASGNLNNTGSLSLTTNTGALTITSNFTAPAAVTLTAAGTLTTPNITSAGDLTLKGSTLNLGRIKSTAGGVSLEATGSDLVVDLSNPNFASNTFATFKSDTGDVSLSNDLSVAGAVTLIGHSVTLGSNNVTSTGSSVLVRATGSALSVDPTNLSANTSLTLRSDTGALSISKSLTNAHDVFLTGDSINLNNHNVTSTSGSVTVAVTGAGTQTFGTSTFTTGADLTMTAAGALTVDGSNLSPGANVTLTASVGALTVNNALTAPQSVSLTGGSLSLGGTVTASAGGISLDATNAGLAVSQSLVATAGQLISLQATGDITQSAAIITPANLSASSSGGDVNLANTGNLIGGTITALSGANVTFVNGETTSVDASAITLGSGGALSLTASAGNLTLTGSLSAPGAVTLAASSAAGVLTTPVISAAGDISLTGGSVSLGGTVTSTGGGVAIDATNASLSVDPPTISTHTYLNLTAAPSGTLTVGTPLSAPGDVSLTGGLLSLTGTVTSTAGGVAIDVTNGGLTIDPSTLLFPHTFLSITASGALDVTTPVINTGNVTLSGGSVILGGLVSSAIGGVEIDSTAADLTINPSTTLSAGAYVHLMSSGALTLQSAVGADTDVTLTGGSIALGGNVLAGGNVILDATASGLALNYPVTATGSLTLMAAGGDITQSALFSSHDFSAAAGGGHNVSLFNANTITGTVTSLSGATVFLGDGQPMTVAGPGVSATTALELVTLGALTTSGGLTTAGSIFLQGDTLSLGGAVQSSAAGMTLNVTGGALTVNHALQVASGQTLTLEATGDITQSAAISAPNFAAFSSGGNVNLTNAGNAIATVTGLGGATVTLADGSAMAVTGSGVSASTALNLSSSAGLSVTGALTNAGSISLTGTGLTFGGAVQSTGGSVSLDATGATLVLNVPVTAATFVQLQASDTISQSQAITAASLSASSGGDITLTGANLVSGSVTVLSGGAVSFSDSDPVTIVGSGVSATGDVHLTSSGLLTIGGGLSEPGNIFLTGSTLSLGGTVQSTNNSVTLDATGGGLSLTQQVQATSSSASVNLQATGAITQTAAISANAFTAVSSGGAVDLSNTSNSITGTVSSLGGTSIILTDGVAMTVTGGGVSTPGALTLTSAAKLKVTGSLTAGGDIVLSGSSIQTGSVHSTGGGVTQQTSGDLTTTGLTSAGNIGLIGGTLTLNGPVQSTGGSVTLGATNAGAGLDIAQTVQAFTTIILNAKGDITQEAALTAAGLSATSTAGQVLLPLSTNAISGPVALSGTNVSFADHLPLTVSSVSASGTLDLTSDGALTVTGPLSAGGDISLTGTSLSLGGAVQSANGGVTLDSTATALAINQAVTAGPGQTVDLISSGVVSQSASGLITAGVLTGQSVGGAVLGQANVIGSLGPYANTGGGALTVNTVSDLTLAGGVSNTAGPVAISANSIAVNASVTGTSVGLTSANGAIGGTGVVTASTGLTASATGGQVALTGVNQVAGPVVLGGTAVSFTNGQATVINAGGLTSASSINLTTTAGNLTVNQALNLPGPVALTAAGVLTTPTITATTGGVSLSGSSVALGGDVQATAGSVSVQSTGALDLNHNITAGGTITLAASAPITEDSGAILTAAHLAASSVGGLTLNDANAVGSVDALVNTGGGGVRFHDTVATSVGGVSTDAGDIALTSTGVLTLTAPLTAPANLTLASGGDFTASQLTLGGNLSLSGTGNVTVSSIQGQAASQLTVSGGNVAIGAAAGQTPSGGQTVQGILAITAQQDASVNVTGNVQVASATLGGAGSHLTVSATNDAVLGALGGAAPAAGNTVTEPAGASIVVSGGHDAVVNLAGAVTITTLTGGRDAIAHTTSGDLAVATAQAGRNLSVISDAGNANLKTATLTGVGTLTLTASNTATLGRLPGEAAPTAAGTLTLDPDTVNLSGATVVVDLTGDAAISSVQAGSGGATINATGAINLAQASSSGALAVTGGGPLTTGALTGTTVLLRGAQLTMNGAVRATQACAPNCTSATLTIESVGGGLTLGDGATAVSPGLAISNAQYAQLQGDAVTLYAGDPTNSSGARGNVAIGNLTLDRTKVPSLTILAGPQATVSVTGVVQGAGTGSGALTIGAALYATGWTPKNIYITGDKGSLGVGGPTLPLAGQHPLQSVTLNAVGDVLFGSNSFVTAINGAQTAGQTNNINVDRNLPPGVAVTGGDLNREFMTADITTIRANGVIAQENTGVTGVSNGILMTNRGNSLIFATLGRTGPPVGSGAAPQVIDLSLAYFNSAGVLINQQIAAASPGVSLGDIPRSDLYRINGCTIGAAGSCTPLPNTIVDISIGKLVQDIRLIASDPPPAYDPTITGAGNEEIWRTTSCPPGQTGSGTCQ